MPPPRPQLMTMVLALTTVALAGCGGGAPQQGEPSRASTVTAAPPPSTAPRPACAAPPPPPRGTPQLAPARAVVDRAVSRAAAGERRFVTRLNLSTTTGLRATALLRGTRRADGSSSGRLRWQGAASLLLPDLTLRIADDQLAIRGAHDAAFRPLGSASGVSLDVGRELLAHPFLLEASTARGTLDDLALTLDAPRDELRDYATHERRGPVTELLRNAELLRITPRVVAGRLVHDRFVLRTAIPTTVTQIEPLAGTTVTLTGSTTTCSR